MSPRLFDDFGFPLSGTSIHDRWQIEKPLPNQGGMSRVYFARDIKFEADCILKVAKYNSEKLKQRFRRECQIGHKIGQESGFVRVVDFGELPAPSHAMYLVMDPVRDAIDFDPYRGSLEERISNILTICQLVQKLHDFKIVHRDLKPANILWTDKGEGPLNIIDYGIAKSSGDLTLTKTEATMGTPYWMSPEQWGTAKATDQRSDVYSIGVMLFQALTNRLPYTVPEGSDSSAILAQIMKIEQNPEQLPNPKALKPTCPVHYSDICQQAMAVKIADRLSTAQEFYERLFKARQEIANQKILKEKQKLNVEKEEVSNRLQEALKAKKKAEAINKIEVLRAKKMSGLLRTQESIMKEKNREIDKLRKQLEQLKSELDDLRLPSNRALFDKVRQLTPQLSPPFDNAPSEIKVEPKQEQSSESQSNSDTPKSYLRPIKTEDPSRNFRAIIFSLLFASVMTFGLYHRQSIYWSVKVTDMIPPFFGCLFVSFMVIRTVLHFSD